MLGGSQGWDVPWAVATVGIPLAAEWVTVLELCWPHSAMLQLPGLL